RKKALLIAEAGYEAINIEKKLEEIYKSHGYEVIRIPFMSLQDRITEILKHTG
ncbi:hypothetical protein HY837_02490, partial [archaeon]|nr:hypothetical protein [archaeon]